MAAPPRFESIEIPERPSVASETTGGGSSSRRRMLLYGGIAALALIVLAVLAVQWSGDGDNSARAPSEAPLIKAEEQPIKVSPESPGGMQVPNRDILVYGRMHGAPDGKPPVERLLPEPERPLPPPKPVDAPAAEPPATAPAPAGTPAPANPPPAAAVIAQPKAPTLVPRATTKPAEPQKPVKASTRRFQVQLFSGRSADEAKAAWAKLKAENGNVLGVLAPSLVKADLGERGTFYRLRAGPIDSEAKAKTVCDALARRGTPCMVVRPGG